MAYTVTFAPAFNVPPLTLDQLDRDSLTRQVTAHAMPHLEPQLVELGRSELAEAFFLPNTDLRGGWFILPSLANDRMARFCPARIEEQQ
jgi:hypothetical protein